MDRWKEGGRDGGKVCLVYYDCSGWLVVCAASTHVKKTPVLVTAFNVTSCLQVPELELSGWVIAMYAGSAAARGKIMYILNTDAWL